MMTNTLKRAIDEAQRFINAARQTDPGTYGGQQAGKEVAATKRASMDLSRVLAELRTGK